MGRLIYRLHPVATCKYKKREIVSKTLIIAYGLFRDTYVVISVNCDKCRFLKKASAHSYDNNYVFNF